MLTKEKVENHIVKLEEKHDELDKRIAKDSEPEYIISVLKREKLHIKDEIEREKQKLTQWDNWKAGRDFVS